MEDTGFQPKQQELFHKPALARRYRPEQEQQPRYRHWHLVALHHYRANDGSAFFNLVISHPIATTVKIVSSGRAQAQNSQPYRCPNAGRTANLLDH